MRHLLPLVLVLLVPCAASAQAAGALGSPVEGSDVPAPPAVAPPPATSQWGFQGAPATDYRLDPELATLRGGVEDTAPADHGPGFGSSFGHAWVGYGIGAAAGGLIGGGIAGAACGNGGMCLFVGVLGAGAGAATLAPFGAGLATWAFGDARGGTGNAFAAIGGAYLGSGLGVALTAGLSQLDPPYGSVLGVALGVVLTNLGAAAAYQLSSSGSAEQAPSDDPIILPTAGATSDGRGAQVGVVGVF